MSFRLHHKEIGDLSRYGIVVGGYGLWITKSPPA
jgi:hypothetical protein